MHNKNASISQKLTLTVIGVSSFFAVLTMVVQLVWNYQEGLDDAKKSIQDYTQSILPSLTQALWDVDRNLLEDLVAGVGMLPMVSGVELVSVDGVYISLGLPKQESDLRQIVFNYPLELRSRAIGHLAVTMNVNALYYQLWQQLIVIVLGNGIKTLLMIYLILTLVRLMVTRRLDALEHFTNLINLTSLKKLSLPEIVTHNSDEISHVGQSLEAMHKRIRSDLALSKWQQRALKQHQTQLTTLVQQRTQALAWQTEASLLLAEIALQFLKADTANMSLMLDHVCQKIGTVFGVERVSIVEFEQQYARYRNFWSSIPGATPLKNVSVTDMNMLSGTFKEQSILVVENIDTIEDSAQREYQAMKSIGIRSIGAFALTDGSKLLGMLSLSNVSAPFHWSAPKTAMLTQFAAALNELLLREQKEQQMQHLQQALVTANVQLQTIAQTDELTGLANRRPFEEALTQVLSSSLPVALVMIDVDHFKAYNDYYGHFDGDKVLQQVAQGLASISLPESSILARIGGEEFAIVMSDVSDVQLTSIAENLCDFVAGLQIPHQKSALGFVTISVGAVLVAASATRTKQSVLRQADLCLYSAKSAGRNRVKVARHVA